MPARWMLSVRRMLPVGTLLPLHRLLPYDKLHTVGKLPSVGELLSVKGHPPSQETQGSPLSRSKVLTQSTLRLFLHRAELQ